MLNKTLFPTILAISIAACAGAPERPTAEMARARTLIDQAEDQGAQQFAGADLERAREKLRRAESEANEGDGEEAERLAMQAALDAELAVAKSNSGKAMKAAEELDRSIESLREESARGQKPPTP